MQMGSLPETPSNVPEPGETIYLFDALQGTPVTAQQIKLWTEADPVLSKVKKNVLQGWGTSVEQDFKPYFRVKDELSISDGCLLRGSRVIVPALGQPQVITELHLGHPGISRMKALARSVAWWPGIDHDLESCVKRCSDCQLNQKSPAPAPLHPWEWPSRPWSRIHIDHAGPFQGKLFLVVAGGCIL